jgi:uncharacterized membrane protein
MDTVFVDLTVSGFVGLAVGLTIGLTLIILGLKTTWDLIVENIIWTRLPWAKHIDEVAAKAADELIARAARTN